MHEGEQRVFPDINFTCNGTLTKWIIGGELGNNNGGEVQIWRRNADSENDYTIVGSSIFDATDTDNDGVFEFIPNPQLNFLKGDILGVFQRRNSQNRNTVYYQETTGPSNYRDPDNNLKAAKSILSAAVLVITQYDYPLVTVEICEL